MFSGIRPCFRCPPCLPEAMDTVTESAATTATPPKIESLPFESFDIAYAYQSKIWQVAFCAPLLSALQTPREWINEGASATKGLTLVVLLLLKYHCASFTSNQRSTICPGGSFHQILFRFQSP